MIDEEQGQILLWPATHVSGSGVLKLQNSLTHMGNGQRRSTQIRNCYY